MAIDSLVSRAYQDELAGYARENNAILAADTGTGKTLISAMVIRSRMPLEKMKYDGDPTPSNKRVALFLVPKVPLVEQQRAFLESNTGLKIRGYTGAMGVDYWDRTAWIAEFMACDVLVMTPQIFLNILRHAHWNMNQVSMIVFDEVHNCKGRSPEAQIMVDHYHTLDPTRERPKILGLTASPIFNVKNPADALQKIERLTDSKVFVVKTKVDELVRFTFQAEDKIIDYPRTPSVFPLYAKPSLWQDLHDKRLLPNDLLFPHKASSFGGIDTKWYRELLARYESSLSALGPFAADVFLLVHMTSNLHSIDENLPPDYPDTPDKYRKIRTTMKRTREVLTRHQERLATDGAIIPNEWLSPKMIALKDLLSKQDPKTLRGMVFVQERQFATTISLILPRLGLSGVRSGPLVGHGQNVCSEPTKVGMKGMSFRAQEHILEDFRKGNLNLLIATSVAEEGLDFPECSLVCRFDPPKTLPQYIQSRGRARKENSSFVILLEEGPSLDRGRLEALQLGEIKVKDMYGKNMETDREDGEPDNEDASSASEGRFVVPETGASITPAGSIGLLNNLCSLIPRDPHTPPLQPRYDIHPLLHTCVVRLPAALPIPREDLEIRGQAVSRTKKAGKRSAAFNAVQRLYKLGVFDQYLLPLRRERGDTAEDIDGKPPIDVSAIEPMMDVLVSDPWGNVWEEGSTPFLHQLIIGEKHGMGLVCASQLASYKGEMMASKELLSVEMLTGTPLTLAKEQRVHLMDLMDRYTKHGIRYSITRKALQKPSSLFLVPVNANGNIDWEQMEACMRMPSSSDWKGVDLSNPLPIFISLLNETRTSMVVGPRPDLKAQDCVAHDKSLSKFVSNASKYMEIHLEDDLVLQCRPVIQATSTEFRDGSRQKAKGGSDDVFFPQSICQRLNFSQSLFEWFALLPPLTSLLCSVFRARAVQKMLNVTIDLNRTIEAFMLPSANASFNNQRLETLGDAFLKLATGIHVFNKFPHKHEGQLSALRQNSVCNRYLLGRGHIQSLVKFMTIEPNTQRRWRLNTDKSTKINSEWFVERTLARRSIQDCMEALLGAAWISGGVSTALEVGTRLGLCFGGENVWWERYDQTGSLVKVNSPFPEVEEVLGYRFRDKTLLLEALTHPSFAKGGTSYQRLEFLGDAVLDLVTMDHFFKTYPTAQSGKLSRARARCVCSPTLSAIGIKKLGVHKILFSDSVSLVGAMVETAKLFESMDFSQVVDNIWNLDPPKAISDVVEALIGAVFKDSGWRYDIVSSVVMRLLDEVIAYVHPDMPADPTSEFCLWVGRYGCTQVHYRDSSNPATSARKDQLFVTVHDVDVGPATIIPAKSSVVLARAKASIQAQQLLEDPMSEFSFEKLCTCSQKEKADHASLYRAAGDLVLDDTDLNPETNEGFATDAQLLLLRQGDSEVPQFGENGDVDSDSDEVADDE
ncbi:hypothetical protein CPB86DRAFT_614430 [Serendipita vermifera]|nr:hypothetical protein CPB86DRAFT_614430 [Serendipita vermifera]